MTRGDVHALSRMAKSDHRAAKVAKKLISKLAKTKRNQKEYTTVYSPKLANENFAGSGGLAPQYNLRAPLRRLLRKRIDRKRVFGVAEIVQGFETVVGLVLAPMHTDASPQLLAEIVTKTAAPKVRVSQGRVELFASRNDTGGAVEQGSHTFLRTVTVDDSLVLYYAATEDVVQTPPHKQLYIHKDTYERVQKIAAGIVGAKLVTL